MRMGSGEGLEWGLGCGKAVWGGLGRAWGVGMGAGGSCGDLGGGRRVWGGLRGGLGGRVWEWELGGSGGGSHISGGFCRRKNRQRITTWRAS